MKYIYFIIAILLLLIGCSNKETVEELKPAPDNESSGYLGRPPNVMISANDFTTGASTLMLLDKYCWETNEKACNLTPSDPHELLSDKQHLKVKSEDNIVLTFSIDQDSLDIDAMFSPDDIMLIQTSFTSGEQQEIELDGFQFSTPKQGGLYYYTLIANWDNDEIKGKAFYGVTLNINN